MEIDKGIKLRFEKSNTLFYSNLEIYNPINRIPVSLKIDYSGNRPTSIYCEISGSENFIELWFDKETKKLYEITIVSIREDTIKLHADDLSSGDVFYECYIESDKLNMSKPIKVLRSDKSLIFSWGGQTSKVYTITKNCMLGVDSENKLCSISLVNLNKKTIYDIIGF